MNLRALVAIALLVPAVFFGRAAPYAQRMVLPQHMVESGMTHVEVGSLLGWAFWAATVAAVAADCSWSPSASSCRRRASRSR